MMNMPQVPKGACEMGCAQDHLTLIMLLGDQVRLGLNRIRLKQIFLSYILSSMGFMKGKQVYDPGKILIPFSLVTVFRGRLSWFF